MQTLAQAQARMQAQAASLAPAAHGASFKVSEDDTSAVVISADHLVDGSVVHIVNQARDTAAATLCSRGACSRVGDWGHLWGAAA